MTSRGLAAANHLGDPDRCVGLCAAECTVVEEDSESLAYLDCSREMLG